MKEIYILTSYVNGDDHDVNESLDSTAYTDFEDLCEDVFNEVGIDASNEEDEEECDEVRAALENGAYVNECSSTWYCVKKVMI